MTSPWPPGEGTPPESQPGTTDYPPPYQQYGPYQHQPWGMPPAPPRTNSLAVTSLVCAIAGLFMLLGCIPAIVFGAIALRQIRDSGENGHGLALAGIIIGAAGIALAILGIIVLFALLHTAQVNCTSGC